MSRTRSYMGMVYASMAWGSALFFVQQGLLYVSPNVLVVMRLLTAAGMLAIRITRSKQRQCNARKPSLMLGLILSMIYLAQAWGMQFTTVVHAGFYTGLFVIFVPIISYLIYRKPITKGKRLAMPLVCAGFWLLSGGVSGINSGDWWIILSAVGYALHIITIQHYMQKTNYNALVLVCGQFLVVGVVSLGMAIRGGELYAQTTLDPYFWYIMAVLVLVPTLSANIIEFWAQKQLSATTVAYILALEPLFAALTGRLIAGEVFVIAKGIAVVLIVIAVIMAES